MSVAVNGECRISIEVFDGISIRSAQHGPLTFSNRKAGAILCYLALSKDYTASRETVAGLLWGDRSEDQARASLRQCIKYLRSKFEAYQIPVFSADRQKLKLDQALFSVDLTEKLIELDAGTVSPDILKDKANPNRILTGYESVDLSFSAWLQIVRQQTHNAFLDKLLWILRAPASSGKQALSAAKAISLLDPTHEEARRHLIRSYAERGSISAALNEYNELWQLLEEQYDIEPSLETERLIADVKLGKVETDGLPKQSANQNSPSPQQNRSENAAGSDAVLALEQSINLVKMEDGTFSPLAATRLPIIGVSQFEPGGFWTGDSVAFKGLRKDLISSIIRFREWVIVEISTPSVSSETEKEQDEINKVDYVLDGAYYQEETSEYLVVTLKNERSRQYIWSEKILVLPETWIAERYKIVRSLLMSLSVHYSASRISAALDHTKASGDIHARWMRAQALIDSYRKPAIAEATEILRGIIDDAPTYSPAYSSLCQILNAAHIFFPGVLRDQARAQKSLDLARKAVELDPLDSRAQLCLGWAYAMSERFNQSILHHKMAKNLNSFDLWTNMSASQGLAFAGEVEEAQAFITRVELLTGNFIPIQWDYIGKIRFLAEDYAGSVEAFEECEHDLKYILAIKAAALWYLDEIDAARDTFKVFISSIRERWATDEPPTDELIITWFLQCFPFRDKYAYRRLENGIRSAGMEASEIRSRAV